MMMHAFLTPHTGHNSTHGWSSFSHDDPKRQDDFHKYSPEARQANHTAPWLHHGQTLHVHHHAGCYPITSGRGLLTYLGHWIPSLFQTPFQPQGTALPRKLLIVTQASVWHHYEDHFREALQANHRADPWHLEAFDVCLIPEGEAGKTLAVAEQVFEHAFQFGLTRRDAMIAFGGGVVGDLTGYCAGLYYRGIPFIQIPTTLLAQIDSSVGGKVAVNFGHKKNVLGQFYQPHGVLADVDFLKTLPEEERQAGLGELVKYALIERTILQPPTLSLEDTKAPWPLWQWLTTHAEVWHAPEYLPTLVHYCCELKATIVKRDEFEQLKDASGRVCLNLGHTFAHAIEACYGMAHASENHPAWLHGTSVALGCVLAARLSVKLGLLSEQALSQIEQLWQTLKLPIHQQTHSVPWDTKALRLAMQADKKNLLTGEVRLILPYHAQEALGSVTMHPMPIDHPCLYEVWETVNGALH
ncbi:MAG: 3-dehydroquinate synthase family protein [Vampirovibrionales bacterium]